MKIEKISLFSSTKDFSLFLILSIFLFALSISYEYYSYTELTKFDSQIVQAKVLKQYTKTKLTKRGKEKTYQVLKLKSKEGFTFYTTASKKLENIKEKNIKLEIWAGKITFYEYMSSFFAFSKIIQIYKADRLHSFISDYISHQHSNEDITSIYEALFLAKPLRYKLQTTFSNLGISHLVAISGFHLGVLSFILFLLLKYPYKFLQNRYFPYRSYVRDNFIITAFILFCYMAFLAYPPSLVRAFGMLLIGFVLYDRGIEIISMQTLLLTVILILALLPRLIFSVGFWLSVSGVFYIFLFLVYFKHLSKLWQFILVPFWIYILMIPYSIVIFGNFSVYHPLSIIWTTLFTLFYPLSILLHILGYGDTLDVLLQSLLLLGESSINVSLSVYYLTIHIVLSFLALYKKSFIWLLGLYSCVIFAYVVLQLNY